jgi:ketosteroid isomerase-like protein
MLSTKEIVTAYYELLTAGERDAWCDLFAPDQVMDEQLVGHVEGQDTLRDMMKGFPDNIYASFEKRPRHVVVDGGTAAVVSHIHAVTHKGATVDADVADYFETKNGQITYFANFHDTVPFAVLSDK